MYGNPPATCSMTSRAAARDPLRRHPHSHLLRPGRALPRERTRHHPPLPRRVRPARSGPGHPVRARQTTPAPRYGRAPAPRLVADVVGPAWTAAASWINAHRTRHLIVLRTHTLTPTRWEQLDALRARAGIHLTLFWHREPATRLTERAARLSTGYQRTDDFGAARRTQRRPQTHRTAPNRPRRTPHALVTAGAAGERAGGRARPRAGRGGGYTRTGRVFRCQLTGLVPRCRCSGSVASRRLGTRLSSAVRATAVSSWARCAPGQRCAPCPNPR